MSSTNHQDYETIMNADGDNNGVDALSHRLETFRRWIRQAGCTVHPAICIVNGEATDGTRNAPVLLLDTTSNKQNSEASITASTNSSNSTSSNNSTERRDGLVDRDEDRILYDRTIGCQVRTVREIKEDQVMMTIPRSVMIHPDLIASSDAGRVALACCEPIDGSGKVNFWDAFGNTAEKEKFYMDKNKQSGGAQLLIKILQERKRVDNILKQATKAVENAKASGSPMPEYKLAKKGQISTRAAVLCFIIQQRFSNEETPMVAQDEFINDHSSIDDACTSVGRIKPSSDTPQSFGPYARTLPPSIPLPICWKRNELALLANCISGVSLLMEVASQIMALSADLIALVEAGIFHRFPHLFSHEALTWDKWIWAASVHASRLLPATCYLNKGEVKASGHVRHTNERFYSPPEVWDELGVMIPLIDMLNHESDAAQITWVSPPPPKDTKNEDDDDNFMEEDDSDDVAKVIMHKKVKKGLQIYTNYGSESNKELLLRYGFAQMANSEDTTSIGWGLGASVGGINCPADYISVEKSLTTADEDGELNVFESIEGNEIKAWWTETRLRLLENQIQSDTEFWKLLRNGKKMTATVHGNGILDPVLLTAVVAATMPPQTLEKYIDSTKDGKTKITITKRHQRIIRKYLLFLFSRKLEKLMGSLDKGLGNHFSGMKLWTKLTEEGLKHKSSDYTGWYSFFDSNAYATAMEVDKGCFYAMSPESCILTLYDGHIRALQASIDIVVSEEKFEESALKQFEDLDFLVSKGGDDDEEVTSSVKVKTEQDSSSKQDSSLQKQSSSNGGSKNDGDKKERRRNRRSRGKGGGSSGVGGGNAQGPSAMKLHIGNLSYQTPPSRLFEFFASHYGRENVLECHIPTERETGKSRGFGFVTMPEAAVKKVLADNLSPQIDGRVVKIAESNTTARTNTNGVTVGVGNINDRCMSCGYRPRYCQCPIPNIPGNFMPGGPMPMMGGPGGPGHMPPPDDIYGPGPLPQGGMDPYYGRGHMNPDFDPRARRRSRSLNRGRSYSRSPSPRHRRSEGRYNERPYRDRRGRSYSRSRSRSGGRSRSRSYSRGRDRRDRDRRDRDRDWDRDSRGRRSRGSRRSSRYSRSRSASLSQSRSRSMSRSRSRSRSRNRSRSRSQSFTKETNSSSRREKNRERKSSTGSSNNVDAPHIQSRNGGRSRSASASPMQNRELESDAPSKDGKRSHRARSKSRERNSRSRKRHKSSRRSKEKRHASRSHSRSF